MQQFRAQLAALPPSLTMAGATNEAAAALAAAKKVEMQRELMIRIMNGGDQMLLSKQAQDSIRDMKTLIDEAGERVVRVSRSQVYKDTIRDGTAWGSATHLREAVGQVEDILQEASDAQKELQKARAEASGREIMARVAGGGGGGGQVASAAAAAAQAEPDECTICTDKLGVRNGPGPYGTITTACRHRFHRKCINDWLNTGNMKCPLCRADLNPPFVGIAGRRQYGAKRYRKRPTRKQGKHYKKKTRRGKRHFRA